jgi:hypothetical protein
MKTKMQTHRFEASDGWRLCFWCGKERSSETHHNLPEGWEPIESAPKNASEIEVLLPSNEVIVAHWAEDMSGEYQPPFRGWFKAVRDKEGKVRSYAQIETPVAWRDR